MSDENLILLTALVPLIIHGFALSFLSSSGNYSSKKQIKEEFVIPIHLLFLLNRKQSNSLQVHFESDRRLFSDWNRDKFAQTIDSENET